MSMVESILNAVSYIQMALNKITTLEELNEYKYEMNKALIDIKNISEMLLEKELKDPDNNNNDNKLLKDNKDSINFEDFAVKKEQKTFEENQGNVFSSEKRNQNLNNVADFQMPEPKKLSEKLNEAEIFSQGSAQKNTEKQSEKNKEKNNNYEIPIKINNINNLNNENNNLNNNLNNDNNNNINNNLNNNNNLINDNKIKNDILSKIDTTNLSSMLGLRFNYDKYLENEKQSSKASFKDLEDIEYKNDMNKKEENYNIVSNLNSKLPSNLTNNENDSPALMENSLRNKINAIIPKKDDKPKYKNNSILENSKEDSNNSEKEKIVSILDEEDKPELNILPKPTEQNKAFDLPKKSARKDKVVYIADLVMKINSDDYYYEILSKLFGDDFMDKLMSSKVDDDLLEAIEKSMEEIEKLKQKDMENEIQKNNNLNNNLNNNFSNNLNNNIKNNLENNNNNNIIENENEEKHLEHIREGSNSFNPNTNLPIRSQKIFQQNESINISQNLKKLAMMNNNNTSNNNNNNTLSNNNNNNNNNISYSLQNNSAQPKNDYMNTYNNNSSKNPLINNSNYNINNTTNKNQLNYKELELLKMKYNFHDIENLDSSVLNQYNNKTLVNTNNVSSVPSINTNINQEEFPYSEMLLRQNGIYLNNNNFANNSFSKLRVSQPKSLKNENDIYKEFNFARSLRNQNINENKSTHKIRSKNKDFENIKFHTVSQFKKNKHNTSYVKHEKPFISATTSYGRYFDEPLQKGGLSKLPSYKEKTYTKKQYKIPRHNSISKRSSGAFYQQFNEGNV